MFGMLPLMKYGFLPLTELALCPPGLSVPAKPVREPLTADLRTECCLQKIVSNAAVSDFMWPFLPLMAVGQQAYPHWLYILHQVAAVLKGKLKI
jgi:hypothetical protein